MLHNKLSYQSPQKTTRDHFSGRLLKIPGRSFFGGGIACPWKFRPEKAFFMEGSKNRGPKSKGFSQWTEIASKAPVLMNKIIWCCLSSKNLGGCSNLHKKKSFGTLMAALRYSPWCSETTGGIRPSLCTASGPRTQYFCGLALPAWDYPGKCVERQASSGNYHAISTHYLISYLLYQIISDLAPEGLGWVGLGCG